MKASDAIDGDVDRKRSFIHLNLRETLNIKYQEVFHLSFILLSNFRGKISVEFVRKI